MSSLSNLGGGVHGSRKEAGFGSTLVGGEVALKRKILRKAFKSNNVIKNNNEVHGKATCGPFRASRNQGDVLSRKYQSCGASNQVSGGDGVSNKDCNTVTNGLTPLEVPLGSGNGKYVSDSSEYVRFKNLVATNLTYNDESFGGDKHNGSYSFLNNIRG